MSIYPMMPRGLFGSALPAMGNQAPQQEKPKFFGEGGAGRGIAGSIGDYLLQMSGMQPIYAPAMRDKQMMQEQQRMAEQQRRAGFDDFVQRKTWERDNMPQGADPTSMQRNYEYLKAIRPDLADQFLESQAMAPPLVVPNADGTRTIYPAGSIPRANSGPQVGAIEDGYRFKGGNPGDPNAWEKVGGGGSNVTGGFLSEL